MTIYVKFKTFGSRHEKQPAFMKYGSYCENIGRDFNEPIDVYEFNEENKLLYSLFGYPDTIIIDEEFKEKVFELHSIHVHGGEGDQAVIICPETHDFITVNLRDIKKVFDN